jgi:hypothetical protein
MATAVDIEDKAFKIFEKDARYVEHSDGTCHYEMHGLTASDTRVLFELWFEEYKEMQKRNTIRELKR